MRFLVEMASDDVVAGNLVRWLVCGAAAGLAVDVGLYPLDTLKSRLQSGSGFVAAGGFRRVYKGMGPAVVGSAPSAAVFFVCYRTLDAMLGEHGDESDDVRSAGGHRGPSESGVFANAVAASLAEVAACVVRVPTELCKQRLQVHAEGCTRLVDVCRFIYTSRGLRGFYQGYASTVTREIPFAMVQLPVYEYLRRLVATSRGGDCTPLDGAACGAVAGATAAAVTAPLDVVKTRVMLNTSSSTESRATLAVLRDVVAARGVAGLFAGVVPRVAHIGLGGFIFFGAYEATMSFTDFLA